MQKHVDLVDLVRSFPTNIYFQKFKFGFDTIENESVKVCFIFTDLPHPEICSHRYHAPRPPSHSARAPVVVTAALFCAVLSQMPRAAVAKPPPRRGPYMKIKCKIK